MSDSLHTVQDFKLDQKFRQSNRLHSESINYYYSTEPEKRSDNEI